MKELKNKDFLGELISGLALEKQEEKRAEDAAAQWRWGRPQGHVMLARCALLLLQVVPVVRQNNSWPPAAGMRSTLSRRRASEERGCAGKTSSQCVIVDGL